MKTDLNVKGSSRRSLSRAFALIPHVKTCVPHIMMD